jgi:hypothetical protein
MREWGQFDSRCAICYTMYTLGGYIREPGMGCVKDAHCKTYCVECGAGDQPCTV